MKAYITISTFKLLINTVEKREYIDKIKKEVFIEHIYNNELLYYIFNRFQLNKLHNAKLLLINSDNEIYLRDTFKFTPLPFLPDPKDKVFYRGKNGGVYHLFNDCENLKNNYVDFHIPQEIKDLEKLYPETNAVDFFRNWFERLVYEQIQERRRTNEEFSKKCIEKDIDKIKSLGKIIDLLEFKVNREMLVLRYNTFIVRKFKNYKDENGESILKELNSEYKLVEEKFTNTGNIGMDVGFDMEKETKKIIQDLSNLCLPQHYGEQLYKLARLSFCYNKEKEEIYEIIHNLKNAENYERMIKNFGGLEKVKNFWKKHYDLSQKAYSIVIKYLLSIYDLHTLGFCSKQLEEYNVHPCKTCLERNQNTPQT
ncbi:hypothetical protein J5295_04115 [Riemerella anatipestifer]|uniref:Uncharacterized protein n=1 Tax=Riemerella anatipestifer (strain ATCC 11845 / DSM 15868 / JCM 9532 / NCTC 11014) TaxID=693978 RepID=E4TAN7_RIEAD|nr:hypothetical protein [Riemerella anatipestifer]ADQ82397.1 hypothetical protein Riean_1239 [Riemerella anatipestifer ATCC 11845 = DSM 15868]AFD56401.1 hypothetical protein RA0C_1508 [Riemerella anatipestifer ATCC 11845 = DSM 15868]AGC39669.1 hypothetical protein G148_0364 [Riemerella anatipestifer RA-CH-2]AKQ39875.1 hypothetical protein AS87_06005 [Riemerella anatipestifer Yb2]EFT36799.1 hypothetical protein RAYM_00240 [Riemerella anatipestifer RA-YM]